MENPNYNENDIAIFTEDSQPPPVLYSQNAVRIFSFFFSSLCGGILMAINLKRMGKPKEAKYVIAAGIGYLIIVLSIGSMLTSNQTSSLSILSNILAAVLMGQFFWDKYIGKDFVYNSRPIWIPLIICIGLIIGLMDWPLL